MSGTYLCQIISANNTAMVINRTLTIHVHGEWLHLFGFATDHQVKTVIHVEWFALTTATIAIPFRLSCMCTHYY